MQGLAAGAVVDAGVCRARRADGRVGRCFGGREGEPRGSVGREDAGDARGWEASAGSSDVWAADDAVGDGVRAGKREWCAVSVWHAGVETGIRGEEDSIAVSGLPGVAQSRRTNMAGGEDRD